MNITKKFFKIKRKYQLDEYEFWCIRCPFDQYQDYLTINKKNNTIILWTDHTSAFMSRIKEDYELIEETDDFNRLAIDIISYNLIKQGM